MKKIILSIGFCGFFALINACGNSNSTPAPKVADGATIFKNNCVVCHGIDGKLGLNGAKDLSKSERTLDERILQVTNGKNMMAPFKGILSPEEIKAVATYTLTLKQK